MPDATQEIAGLEARLAAARGRIEAGLAHWPSEASAEVETAPVEEAPDAPSDDSGELAKLREELEEERSAYAQLQQRVKQIRRRQEEKVKGLEAELEKARAGIEAAEAQSDKVRWTNKDMRQALRQMQEASSSDAGVDAHLINRAMMAELEALRADRAAEAREVGALIEALEPMDAVEESEDA